MNTPRLSPRGSLAFPSLLLASLVLITGCTTKPPTHVMRDPQAQFDSFKTFAWDTGQETSQVSGEPLSIVNSQIRGAITTELKQKGYAEAAAGTKSDLLLRYETAAAEKIKSNPFRIGIGMGGYGSNGAAGVGVSSPDLKNVKEGMLVLRVIDPVRNAEVWNGRVSRELGKSGVPDPELIKSAVGELLTDFPASGVAPKTQSRCRSSRATVRIPTLPGVDRLRPILPLDEVRLGADALFNRFDQARLVSGSEFPGRGSAQTNAIP